MKKINILVIGLLLSTLTSLSQNIKIGYTNVEYILSFLPLVCEYRLFSSLELA